MSTTNTKMISALAAVVGSSGFSMANLMPPGIKRRIREEKRMESLKNSPLAADKLKAAEEKRERKRLRNLNENKENKLV